MPRRWKWRPIRTREKCELCGKTYIKVRDFHRFCSPAHQRRAYYLESKEGRELLRKLKSRKTGRNGP